jgi:hypothetical protein
MYRDADPNNTPSQDIVWAGVMQAGDVMHIPRGHWHQATRDGRGSGNSLHVTFGITKRTGASWLAWLGDWCRENEIFRHDLDRWHGTGTGSEALIEATDRLVRERPPAEFLAAHGQEVTPTRHVPFLDIFGPLDSVVCATHFPPQIRENDENVDVLVLGKRLTFATKALPALRLLLSGMPVHLAQTVTVAGAEVTEIAEILVEEQICAPLTPELSLGYTGLVTSAAS